MYQPSDEELVQFSKRLLHSVQLYFQLSRTLTRVRLGIDPESPWDTSSAQVESFAMHTRAFADFFYRFKRRRFDDAFAFHFFDSPEDWRKLVGEAGPWLRRVRFTPETGSPEDRVDRFAQQIAHLNYHVPPVSDFARGWPVMQLSNELGVALARSQSTSIIARSHVASSRRHGARCPPSPSSMIRPFRSRCRLVPH